MVRQLPGRNFDFGPQNGWVDIAQLWGPQCPGSGHWGPRWVNGYLGTPVGQWVSVKWLDIGCQMVVNWLSNGCQLVVKWLSNGCQLVA